MLKLEQVFKKYRRGTQAVDALSGVDLAIDAPGFYAVMGRSGSGKSTLLHLAAGLDRADRGRIEVGGLNLGGMSERQLTQFRRRHVGIVFQQFNLIPTLTARENIGLPGIIDGRPRAWIDQRVAQLMKQLEIEGRAHHRPDAMSGGEQQRVAIARALLFGPAVLLADEPTGSLDSASSEILWRLLSDLAQQQQITVLMVTHEPAAAVNCKKVFVLGDGRCLGHFDVDSMDAGSLATRYQQFGR